MSVNLFDVNVLLALAWPNHGAHHAAIAWFKVHGLESFATCPITEAGFVRLSLNSKVVSESKSATAVLDLLARVLALPNHEFWPDDLPVATALGPFSLLAGHRQVTDAYLLALAASKGGYLVTMDRKIADAAPETMHKSLIVIE